MASAITPQATDFPRWYQDVVSTAEMADNGPVRGTMVIRPYAYAIWEFIQSGLDQRIKRAGVQNAYFPLFIPESYLAKEAEHVEGFSPELAIVTHAGGSELAEPVVVRPTSETVIGEFMAKWIQSHRDLPLLLNQWANVVRWEMRPRMFLRTSEFLWQEGHTAHATDADAAAFARRIHLEVYDEFIRTHMAVPTYIGIKPPSERFAGATNTMTLEGMMKDGKALQMATSHELGQNFAKAFDIQFQTDGGSSDYAYTTSWGASTRLLGGLIMAHGDDNGLVVPPRIAPYLAVVIPVRDDEDVTAAVTAIGRELTDANIRHHLDSGRGNFGRRVTDWEIKGVPLRIEVGPRDLAEGRVTIARRDTGEKIPVPLAEVVATVRRLETEIHDHLYESARQRRDGNTHDVTSVSEAIEAADGGFARLPWAVAAGAEAELKTHAITVRCLQRADGSLPEREDEPGLTALVAKSY